MTMLVRPFDHDYELIREPSNALCLTRKFPTPNNKAINACSFPLQIHEKKSSRDPILHNFPQEKQETQHGIIVLSEKQHNWQSENQADNNLACHMLYFITYIPNINAKM